MYIVMYYVNDQFGKECGALWFSHYMIIKLVNKLFSMRKYIAENMNKTKVLILFLDIHSLVKVDLNIVKSEIDYCLGIFMLIQSLKRDDVFENISFQKVCEICTNFKLCLLDH